MRSVDGTCVFVDVSGFTKLSERLARRGGREGAEQLADAIGDCFENLLGVAYGQGGGLLKFGGDALLLLFDGEAHLERACASAVAMGARLRELGPIETGSAPVTLRMSVGVHSAEYLLFAVGSSHRELLISGPAATEVVRMEKEAGTGEIVVSAATAAALPPALRRPGARRRPAAALGAAGRRARSRRRCPRRSTRRRRPSRSRPSCARTCWRGRSRPSTASSRSRSCASRAPTGWSSSAAPMAPPPRCTSSSRSCRRRPTRSRSASSAPTSTRTAAS